MKDSSADTLEHCISLCEETLRRFGIRTLAGDSPDALYGRAFLEILDSDTHVIRPYPRSNGNAEFRSFCRSYGLDHVPEILGLLSAFRDLTPYIWRYLSKPDFVPPEVTEGYIHQILLNDIIAWPDALFAGFEYDLTDLERGLDSYFVAPDFTDLHGLWRKEARPAKPCAMRSTLFVWGRGSVFPSPGLQTHFISLDVISIVVRSR